MPFEADPVEVVRAVEAARRQVDAGERQTADVASSEEDSWAAYLRVDATAGEFNEKVAPTLRRLFEPFPE